MAASFNLNPNLVKLYILSKEVTQEDFEGVKFLFQDQLGDRQMEKCLDARALFKLLKENEVIKDENYSALRDALRHVGRNDLVSKFFNGNRLRLDDDCSFGETTPEDCGEFYPTEEPCDMFQSPVRVFPSTELTQPASTVSRAGSSVSRAASSTAPLASSISHAATSVSEGSAPPNSVDELPYDLRMETLKPIDFESSDTEVKRVADSADARPAILSDIDAGREVFSDSAGPRRVPPAAEEVKADGGVVLANAVEVSLDNLGACPRDSAVFTNAGPSEFEITGTKKYESDAASDADPSSPDFAIDENVFRKLPTLDDGRIDHDRILKQLKFSAEMRDYQKSMAEPGLRGENSIVVLQTGGGKTHIAAYITRYHSMKAVVDRKSFLCLFLVPIRHLAGQQQRVYQEAFQGFGTSIAKDTDELMNIQKEGRNKEVVFCTAQILVNALNDKRIDMSKLSLIIMDECHHTSGGHPNQRAMAHYMNDKKGGKRVRDLPQIIGLSASLGAGDKTKSEEREDLSKQAFQQLLLICANLDSSIVVFPRTEAEKASLSKHCHDQAEEEIIPVITRPNQDFYRCLHRFVTEALGFFEEPVVDVKTISLGDDEGLKQIDKIIEREIEADDKQRKIAADYLKEFSKAFSHLKILRCWDVVQFLENNKDLPFSPNHQETISNKEYINHVKGLWEKNLPDLRTNAKSVDATLNPILKKLKELLIHLFSLPESRGIILIQQRFSTEAIEEFVARDEELSKVIRPCRFVGQTEMSDHVGLTNLERFRRGECNLLVATDIAQEGIDIPQCNFVIRYHFVSNEIGATQAVGRARKEDSQCYLLVIQGSPEQKHEEHNRRLIVAMKDALVQYAKICKNDDTTKWKKKVLETQEHASGKKKCKSSRAKNDPDDYWIVCAGCHHPLCGADEIVKIEETSNHLVRDKEAIEDRIYRPPGDDEGIYCGECKTKKVGVEIAYNKGIRFRGPQICITARSVKYRKEGGRAEPKSYFAWDQAPFRIETESFRIKPPELSDSDED